ncbi:MAG TPA: hypothetical protein VFW75_08755, partial [Acetobacteraceae bacterium]|nr:hypothetical protein [Acetobacteraceae bacterium]
MHDARFDHKQFGCTREDQAVPNDQSLQYLRLPIEKDARLKQAYDSSEIVRVQDYLENRFPALKGTFRVTSLPSLDWELVPPEDVDTPPPAVDHYVIAVEVLASALSQFHHEIIAAEGESAVGADLSAGTGEYWCPLSVDQALFGNRQQSRDLIHVEVLNQSNPPLRGGHVNVVVVDHGLDKRFVTNFRGGWKHRNPYKHAQVHFPGMTVGDESAHGRMMVRNIQDAAPDANIWDLPLIPPRIWDIRVFINDAQAAFDRMLKSIQHLSAYPRWNGPWVLVNPWAIFDRRSERPPGNYTARLTHPFNQTITDAIGQGRDVIFCAG